MQVMVGKAWYHQMMRSGNVDFSCRSSVVKWIYEHDFVSDFAKLDSVKRIQDVSHAADKRGGYWLLCATIEWALGLRRVGQGKGHRLQCASKCCYGSLLCLMSLHECNMQVKAKLESRKEKPAARFFY